ncbi:hypothetical protein KC959_02985 [Candidatus Saccharibacteria bacterium]|nr:hypothetical protein [Candidatus Saccharibacteria bacterium]
MSQESVVSSHEGRAAELASGFSYINYRTIDFDDAFDLALEESVAVLKELESVDVTDTLKDQAAFCVGQYFLDALADCETRVIANDLKSVLDQLPKPYILMVRVPGAEVSNG